MQSSGSDELVQLLAALCSSEKEPRTAAEKTLAAGQLQPGFPSKLAAFALSEQASPEMLPLRQMGLSILKRLSSEHWSELAEEDRGNMRSALLNTLAEPCSRLRGLLHVCIANIRARMGSWPELQERLWAGIAKSTEKDALCCLECLAVLLEECSLEVALSLRSLQEPMLALAASDAAQPALRRECVSAHTAGVNTALAGEEGTGAAGVVLHDLPAWLEVHAKLCTGLQGWSDSERLACAFCAIRTVTTFSRLRPLEGVLAQSIESVLRPACLLAQKLEPAYEHNVIFHDDNGESEEDGGVSQFITQLVELLQSMLTKPKLRALLKGHIRSMLQLIVPFMRITEAQVKAWRADPNEFLVHEEDDYARGCAVRLSGESLIGELLDHSKREGVRALAAITADLLERGQQRHAAGEAHAWKMVEVALFLFGNTAAEVQPQSLRRSELAGLVPTVLGATGRLCADAGVPEFLRARAFALLQRLGDAVCSLVPQDLPSLLQTATAALRPTEPLVVRVCACKAFCRFLSAVDDTAFRRELLLQHSALASLASLMQDADEELLHLVLESLCVIVKQCPSAIVSAEGVLVPLILRIWQRCIADPMVHLQVLDLVSCACSSDPKLQQSMEDRLLPSVRDGLHPDADHPHVMASSIELYGVLLKRAELPFSSTVLACLELLLAAVMQSDESRVLQNACEVLCCVMRRSPSQVSGAGYLGPMLQCVERLLGPELDDDACLRVGQLVMLCLSQFGALMAADLKAGLLKALVTRLVRAERPYLQQELVVVLARLLCKDVQGTVLVLSSVRLSAQTGLEAFLSVWMRIAKDIRARSARQVTLSALCRLHERCLEDSQLQNIRIGDAALANRLMAAMVAGLEFENDRCQRLKDHPDMDAGAEEEEDDDDEEGDDDHGASGLSLLSELVDLDDDDEDDLDDVVSNASGGGGNALFEHDDPLRTIDLQRVAAEYLATHAACAAGQPDLAERLQAAVARARDLL